MNTINDEKLDRLLSRQSHSQSLSPEAETRIIEKLISQVKQRKEWNQHHFFFSFGQFVNYNRKPIIAFATCSLVLILISVVYFKMYDTPRISEKKEVKQQVLNTNEADFAENKTEQLEESSKIEVQNFAVIEINTLYRNNDAQTIRNDSVDSKLLKLIASILDEKKIKYIFDKQKNLITSGILKEKDSNFNSELIFNIDNKNKCIIISIKSSQKIVNYSNKSKTIKLANEIIGATEQQLPFLK